MPAARASASCDRWHLSTRGRYRSSSWCLPLAAADCNGHATTQPTLRLGFARSRGSTTPGGTVPDPEHVFRCGPRAGTVSVTLDPPGAWTELAFCPWRYVTAELDRS